MLITYDIVMVEASISYSWDQSRRPQGLNRLPGERQCICQRQTKLMKQVGQKWKCPFLFM